MIALDTNVLLRLILADDAVQHRLAVEVFETLTPARPGFVTFVSMLELTWTLRSGYGFTTAQVLDTVENLLTSAQLEFDDGESMWTALLEARAGADFADGLLVQTARLYGCESVVTFDRRAASSLGMRLLS